MSSKVKQTKKNGRREHKTTVRQTTSSDSDSPIWLFTNIDRDGKFAFDLNREDFQSKEVLDKMISYSNMTWGEIGKQTHDDGKSKHHYLLYSTLSKEARDRFNVKHLDEDSDNIYSFALQNKLRIVGIRRGREFYVLWYDPKHEVCPSTKR